MAGNDQNDEYRFDESDSLHNESLDNLDSDEQSDTSPRDVGEKKNVKRNALIAVGLIVFAMLMYKFIGGMFSGTPAPKAAITPAPMAEALPTTPPVAQTEIPPQPIQPEPQPQPIAQQPPPVQQTNTVLEQKVASIEVSQQSVQSEVSSMSQQVGNVNTNVNALNAQVARLNQMISDLNNQLAKQSEVINVLMVRTKPKVIKKVVSTRIVTPPINYYINAVIPGRAWLIGTNGSTLTVREGTNIAGYGIVKLIDSMQGRILTSSGRIVKFSQEDS